MSNRKLPLSLTGVGDFCFPFLLSPFPFPLSPVRHFPFCIRQSWRIGNAALFPSLSFLLFTCGAILFFCCLPAIFSIYMYFLYFSIFFYIFICIYQKIVVPLHRLSEWTDMTYCIFAFAIYWTFRNVGSFKMTPIISRQTSIVYIWA